MSLQGVCTGTRIQKNMADVLALLREVYMDPTIMHWERGVKVMALCAAAWRSQLSPEEQRKREDLEPKPAVLPSAEYKQLLELAGEGK